MTKTTQSNSLSYTIFISIIVSLGGFLFGFDAGIISGVMEYASPEFNLKDGQAGWVVSSPTFIATITMLFIGGLSDKIGRKSILLVVGFGYALSALLSAYASSYEMLYMARMLGGFAFGAALILAPMYIAEISTPENRGKLVSIQQLNIVLGFFAAFLSNYYFNDFFKSGSSFLTENNIWRWMLGAEFFPAIAYFLLLFLVPKSPRWLFAQNRNEEGKAVLEKLYGADVAARESEVIINSLQAEKNKEKVAIGELFKPALRFILLVGLTIGILQQVTGINAVYFYANSIFKQTGIGTNAAFTSGVLLSGTSVVFTLIAMYLIDRVGRRPLLLVGMAGIAASLLLCAYGFNQATYQLTSSDVVAMESLKGVDLTNVIDKTFTNDVDFKNSMKTALGNQLYLKEEGAIIEAAATINAPLILIGILGFIACFAFSLGPVMWVMLSEMYPTKYRGLAIGFIGFINSFSSWLVQQVFPWELSNLGNAMSFLIFGLVAFFGFFILLKILPETKGKSLEQLEKELVR